MKNNISFTSILNKKGRSVQPEHSAKMKMAEYVQQYELYPQEEYVFSCNQKFMMSQRSKNSSIRLFSSKEESKEMFDSWIQKQTMMNCNSNKENIRAQERRGFGSELKGKDENQKKLIGSRNNFQQSQALKEQQKYKTNNAKNQETDIPPVYSRQNSSKMLADDNLEAEEEYYAPPAEKVRSPKILKENQRKNEEENNAQLLRNEFTKIKQEKLNEVSKVIQDQNRKKKKIEEFSAHTKETILEEIEEIAKKIIKEKQISEIEQEELLIDDSDKKSPLSTKPLLQKKTSSEKNTPLVFDQSSQNTFEENQKRKRLQAKKAISEMFMQINQNKLQNNQDKSPPRVFHQQEEISNDVGYSFSHNATGIHDDSETKHTFADNQVEISLGNIQQIRSELPSEGTDRKMQESEELHFRKKYLKMPSIDLNEGLIKNIQSVNYDLDNGLQESKAIAFPDENKIYSPRQIRREHEIREQEIQKEEIQKMSAYQSNSSQHLKNYFDESIKETEKFKEETSSISKKYAVPEPIVREEEHNYAEEVKCSNSFPTTQEEIAQIVSQITPKVEEVPIFTRVDASKESKPNFSSKLRIESEAYKSPEQSAKNFQEKKPESPAPEITTFKAPQVKFYMASPQTRKIEQFSELNNLKQTTAEGGSPYQTIKSIKESLVIAPSKQTRNQQITSPKVQKITHEPVPAAKYFADRSPLKSSRGSQAADSYSIQPIVTPPVSIPSTPSYVSSISGTYNSPSSANNSTGYTTTYQESNSNATVPIMANFTKVTSPKVEYQPTESKPTEYKPTTVFELPASKPVEESFHFMQSDVIPTQAKVYETSTPLFKEDKPNYLTRLDIKQSITVEQKSSSTFSNPTTFLTRKVAAYEQIKVGHEPPVKFSKTIVTQETKPNFNMHFPTKNSIRNSIEDGKGVGDSGTDFKFQLDDF